MKIVLDTNVLISGLLSPKGIPAQILNLIQNKKVLLLIDTRIFSEYAEVLRRPKFKFKAEWINPFLDFIKMESEYVTPESVFMDFPDPDDKMFWEVAKSGNTRHFPEDPMVVTPCDFLEQYNQQFL